MRLRIDLAYDGTDFHGWARQPGLRTVQGVVEEALSTVLRTPGTTVTCAGRTDTGVHARGQVVHVDVVPDALAALRGRSTDEPEVVLGRRLDGVLDADVRVRAVTVAPEGFDARFSALWRRYVYRVADPQLPADPLSRSHVLTWPRELDVAAMNHAAAALVGEHDFAAFCRRRDGATTVRELLQLHCERDDSGLVAATVRADAFCHSMVRSLMGCLLTVGEGRRDPSWAGEVLVARLRDPAVPVVAAHGLTLEEVRYPPAGELAERASATRRVRDLPPG